MFRRNIGGPAELEVSCVCLGALPFGSTVDEATSFAILDRFVEGGGNLIDTANNYVFWLDGSTGDESETTVGRWLASRGSREDMVLSTKGGGRPRHAGAGLEAAEGLSRRALSEAIEGSLRRLGTEWVDVYWAHIEDRSVPLEETLATLDGFVRAGSARVLGCSNHASWRVEQARAMARAQGWTPYMCLQNRYSYLQPRFDLPLPEAGHVHATPELLDYVRHEPELTLMCYTTLLYGAYSRAAKTLSVPYDHPGTPRRLAALQRVAKECGATPNQVVLAWLIGGTPSVLPVIGVSTVAQLDELLAATTLELDPEHRECLDNPL